jgi:hypothetical protein
MKDSLGGWYMSPKAHRAELGWIGRGVVGKLGEPRFPFSLLYLLRPSPDNSDMDRLSHAERASARLRGKAGG